MQGIIHFNLVTIAVITSLFTAPLSAKDTIVRSNYRIASSHDGNAHDEDDVLAAPMVLAFIAEASLKDKFVFMDYSNHIWNDDGDQADLMREAVEGAAEKWEIDKSKLFEVRVPAQLAKAKAAFKAAAIEAYDANAVLYYSCGAPMEVPYQLISPLDKKYRDNIHILTHSPWNNDHGLEHNAHTWGDLVKIVGKNTRIRGQNSTVLNSEIAGWDWLKNKGGKYTWLYDRNIKDTFDGSDAGMTYYVITGRGNARVAMDDMKVLFNGEHALEPTNNLRIPASLDAQLLIENSGPQKLSFTVPQSRKLYSINILNAAGRSVFNEATQNQAKTTVSIGGLTDGIYSVSASTDTGVLNKKFMLISGNLQLLK